MVRSRHALQQSSCSQQALLSNWRPVRVAFNLQNTADVHVVGPLAGERGLNYATFGGKRICPLSPSLTGVLLS
jgi:hypothetical protein